ncbi:MAG: hydrogenase maturation protease [Ammonifex sp.]|nr:MAG: hydrogenase maturation protease [Ammonifex sp.]
MGSGEPKLLVLGVGNILLQDEGAGVHTVRELMKRKYPPEIEFVDGGTAGLDLLYLIEEASHLIIIDAVNGEAEAGTIFKFNPEDVEERFLPVKGNSLHDFGIMEMLHLGKSMGVLPQTVIYGIQPAAIEWGMALTPKVAAALPRLIKLVEEEIELWLARNTPANRAAEI